MSTLNADDKSSSMKEPKTDLYPQPQVQQESPVPVENLSASSKTVISIIVAVAVATVGWVTIRGDISANNKDLAALSKKVDRIEEGLKAFDRLNEIQNQVNNLRANGSDNLKTLKEEVDKLREAFRVHVAKTSKEPDPLP